MKFLNKMERKFGKYAIHNLMFYVIGLQLAGALLGVLTPELVKYLYLDISQVLRGQVWRLVTFVVTGFGFNMQQPINILLSGVMLYFYYYIGKSLENTWGTFRFNVYYFSGYLLNIIAAFLFYFVFTIVYDVDPIWLVFDQGILYLNETLLLAAAVMFPNHTIYFNLLIPLKMKWLGIIYGLQIAYEVFDAFRDGDFVLGVAILIAILNFIIFFLITKRSHRFSGKHIKRRVEYTTKVHQAQKRTRHRCSVCGRTEADDENLEFRFCSKCDGSYEYCMEHLFTHEHVKKH